MRFMTPDTAIAHALNALDITIPRTGNNSLEVTFGTDPHTWVDYIPAATIGSREPDGDLSRITAPIPVDADIPGDITFPDPARDDVTQLILGAGIHLTPFLAARILSAWSDNHLDGYDTWIMPAMYPPYTVKDLERITDTTVRSRLYNLHDLWLDFGEKCEWDYATDFEFGRVYEALIQEAVRADIALRRAGLVPEDAFSLIDLTHALQCGLDKSVPRVIAEGQTALAQLKDAMRPRSAQQTQDQP